MRAIPAVFAVLAETFEVREFETRKFSEWLIAAGRTLGAGVLLVHRPCAVVADRADLSRSANVAAGLSRGLVDRGFEHESFP
jgi:hypothetical protein